MCLAPLSLVEIVKEKKNVIETPTSGGIKAEAGVIGEVRVAR